jgi:hypothetical protein
MDRKVSIPVHQASDRPNGHEISESTAPAGEVDIARVPAETVVCPKNTHAGGRPRGGRKYLDRRHETYETKKRARLQVRDAHPPKLTPSKFTRATHNFITISHARAPPHTRPPLRPCYNCRTQLLQLLLRRLLLLLLLLMLLLLQLLQLRQFTTLPRRCVEAPHPLPQRAASDSSRRAQTLLPHLP